MKQERRYNIMFQMDIKGEKTIANLKTALAGEVMAYTKYQWYANQALKDGYRVLYDIFNETAANENEHARMWFKALHGGEVPHTEENLKDAYAGENYEWETMYQNFAKDAEEEGNLQLAAAFRNVGEIEHHHRNRYEKMLQQVEAGTVFKRMEKVRWMCLKCGYICEAKEAPLKCPVCQNSQANFQLLEDYDC